MYSVNNLIMSRADVQHEWHNETLRDRLQGMIMIIHSQMNSGINLGRIFHEYVCHGFNTLLSHLNNYFKL